MNTPLRILIVADNLLTRAGLAALLEQQAACQVIGQSSRSQILASVDLYQPDLLLVDLGWQTQEMLKALAPLANADLPILALLNEEEDAEISLASLLRFRLYGLVLNDNDADLLLKAIESVAAGLIVLDPALMNAFNLSTTLPSERLPEALTPREGEVLQLLAQGLTNKAIAHQLGITDHTVKFHVNALMGKLDAQSRTEVVIRASRAGLIIL